MQLAGSAPLRVIHRLAPAAAAIATFFGFTALFATGHIELYVWLLHAWGISPTEAPFIDIGGSLAAWECARQGIDVVIADPCDVLHRGYNYSPFWMTLSGIPLGVAQRTATGWCLGLTFLASLAALPPARRGWDLVFTIPAAISTMVVFAVERSNPDILLFEFFLAAGFVAQRGPVGRCLAYCLCLLAAAIKYYPMVLLAMIARETFRIAFGLTCAIGTITAIFLAIYYPDMARGLPNITTGAFYTDLFAAKNVPGMFGMIAQVLRLDGDAPSPQAGSIVRVTQLVTYLSLVALTFTHTRRIMAGTGWRTAIGTLSPTEETFLIYSGLLITGCFFAGQSIGYRGIFLLLGLPGWLALGHAAPDTPARRLGRRAALVVLFLMWGEALRGLVTWVSGKRPDEIMTNPLYPPHFIFWGLREFAWWWLVSVMLAVIGTFLLDSPALEPILRRLRPGALTRPASAQRSP